MASFATHPAGDFGEELGVGLHAVRLRTDHGVENTHVFVVMGNTVYHPNRQLVLFSPHPRASCVGDYCVIHNPSDHHMREWEMHWRAEKGLMERICPHFVGHPDPDDLAFHVSQGRTYQALHGCDGCCQTPGYNITLTEGTSHA